MEAAGASLSDPNLLSEEQDEEPLKDEEPSDDPSSPSASHQTSAVPVQKRRRVTRACDECRRKKIKCDGRQPCTHCTVYSYDCSYDQPSNRRRNPGPRYVETLERKLQRAEALLHTIAPEIDLDDPSLDNTLSPVTTSNSSQVHGASKQASDSPTKEPRPQLGSPSGSGLESMVKATGQLDLDERGHWNYYGHSSGLNFLRRIRDQFGNVVNPEEHVARSTPFARSRSLGQDFSNPNLPVQDMGQTFQTSALAFETSDSEPEDLPTREVARELCKNSLDHGSAILNLVHKPSFWNSFDRIYDIDPEMYEKQDHRFLPLLYTTLAMGCLFAKPNGKFKRDDYGTATDMGCKFMGIAKQLMDITDCRDITSLQAIIFMILFLQCSAKLSTCYSYIGIALRSALRMGLHRSFQDSFTPIEAETRKRAFWVIRKMDVYCGAMLGLPLTLSEEDFDQDFPTEVDDEYITETEIKPMPAGSVPLVAASNANFRLCKILTKIVRSIYPIKGFQNREQNPSRTYSVSFATICELENDLKTWEENLPPELKPGGPRQPSHIGPMQQLLRMAYAHAQMMLYRPFLHYVSSRGQPLPIDKRSYGCAAACVSVSRNIIHITSEMVKEGLLIGSYWFTMYTAFFAVLSLLYFAVENPESPTAQEIMRDAREGRETLAKLAKTNMAADRCTTTLSTVFESIQATLDEGAKAAASSASRKREAPPQTPNPEVPSARVVQSQPNLQDTVGAQIPQRPHTFPLKIPQAGQRAQRNAKTAPPQQPPTKNVHRSGKTTSTSKPYMPTVAGTPDSTASGSSTYGTPMTNPLPLFARKQNQSSQQAFHPQQQQSEPQRPQPQPHQSQQPEHQQTWPQAHQSQPHDNPRPQPQPHQSQQPQQSEPRRPSYQLQQLHQTQHQSTPTLGHQQPQHTYLQNFQTDLQNPATLPDFSAMMFPSADPFAYPNQPMITLEQNYAYNPYDTSSDGLRASHENNAYIPASTAASGTVSADEHIDVQLFGPLPPYLMQSASSGSFHHGGHNAMDVDMSQGHTPGIRGGAQGWSEQMRAYGLENFNYDDIFGNEEEWRGLYP